MINDLFKENELLSNIFIINKNSAYYHFCAICHAISIVYGFSMKQPKKDFFTAYHLYGALVSTFASGFICSIVLNRLVIIDDIRLIYWFIAYLINYFISFQFIKIINQPFLNIFRQIARGNHVTFITSLALKQLTNSMDQKPNYLITLLLAGISGSGALFLLNPIKKVLANGIPIAYLECLITGLIYIITNQNRVVSIITLVIINIIRNNISFKKVKENDKDKKVNKKKKKKKEESN